MRLHSSQAATHKAWPGHCYDCSMEIWFMDGLVPCVHVPYAMAVMPQGIMLPPSMCLTYRAVS